MARYRPVWVEVAREQYAMLPTQAQEQVDTRIAHLLADRVGQPRSSYDRATDQWTTTYGSGAGLIVYVVVREHERLIILRLV